MRAVGAGARWVPGWAAGGCPVGHRGCRSAGVSARVGTGEGGAPGWALECDTGGCRCPGVGTGWAPRSVDVPGQGPGGYRGVPMCGDGHRGGYWSGYLGGCRGMPIPKGGYRRTPMSQGGYRGRYEGCGCAAVDTGVATRDAGVPGWVRGWISGMSLRRVVAARPRSPPTSPTSPVGRREAEDYISQAAGPGPPPRTARHGPARPRTARRARRGAGGGGGARVRPAAGPCRSRTRYRGGERARRGMRARPGSEDRSRERGNAGCDRGRLAGTTTVLGAGPGEHAPGMHWIHSRGAGSGRMRWPREDTVAPGGCAGPGCWPRSWDSGPWEGALAPGGRDGPGRIRWPRSWLPVLGCWFRQDALAGGLAQALRCWSQGG